MDNFKDLSLSTEIVRALSNLNYHTPTEVQAKVIPHVLANKDLVVKSQTGSGKTASFGIPLCELVSWEENKPQALILTPTRELAVQIEQEITNIGRFKRVKVTSIFGKASFEKQKLQLKQKSHIVVGTPGRVFDHMKKGTISLEKISYLVIDEADEMLNMGFIDQVENIIKKLPKQRTAMLFSATLPEDIDHLAKNYLKEPALIEIAVKETEKHKIEHTKVFVQDKEKFSVLRAMTITENPDSCLIFCNTQQQVEELIDQLNDFDYPCDKSHGGMYQDDRFAVMNDFKRGKFIYLVATNVAARGIDIDNITLVIHYDFPLERESYVHRTGRTGRAGRSGKSICFVTNHEKQMLDELEAFLGFELTTFLIPEQTTVKKAEAAFRAKITAQPKLKQDKSKALNETITKLYFNGGKKKKLRAIDFVGTLTSIHGVMAEDIGIINIESTATFVDILNGKGDLVLKEMKQKTIKGKVLKVHKAKKS